MKKKELLEIRKKDDDKLNTLLKEKKADLAKVIADMKVGKEKNLKKAKNIRNEIAQIVTIVKEKELSSHAEETVEK